MTIKTHIIAATIAFLTISSFWVSTFLVEIFGSLHDIATVKKAILYSMLILIPSMIAAGASGFKLAKQRKNPIIIAKQTRMKILAINGFLVLLPSAFFLSYKADMMTFDIWFYGIQSVELFAGGTNITLLLLNMKDGFSLSAQRLSPK